MATTTYLSNPSVLLGAVDVSDQCSSATITVGYDQLETTAFGSTGRSFAAGLESVEVTLTLFNSYGASEIEATLSTLVGTTSNITIYPSGTTPGVSNPEYEIVGAFLANFTPISANVGELSTVDVTFVGGTWARATS